MAEAPGCRCIIYDADDGSFDITHMANVFSLCIEHASVPAFCSRVAVAGVWPRAGSMWSQEVCSAFRERIMGSPLFIQVELVREGTVLAQVRCNADGFLWKLGWFLVITRVSAVTEGCCIPTSGGTECPIINFF